MPSLEELLAWRENTPNLPPFMPDYHRLQLEWWVWRETHALAGKRILDIGSEYAKPYLAHLGDDYVTANYDDPSEAEWIFAPPLPDKPKVLADIHDLPFPESDFDIVLCTETFEHISAPWLAAAEVRRVLKPGGIALLTAPFMWPWHGSARYADFWRFTADGWRLLLKDFSSVRVFPTQFLPESPILELMASEGMGNPDHVRYATGYVVKAEK